MGRFAFDGPAVVVPARVAALLEHTFDLAEMRETAYRRGDRAAYEVLNDLHAVALQWVADVEATVAAGSGNGTALDAGQELAAPSPGEKVSASEVAKVAECTQRAVTKAASEGRLQGRRVAGRWWFTPAAVAEWMATRAA